MDEKLQYVTEQLEKNNQQHLLDYYKKIGEEVIKNGQLAVVTMAGGQGTRLGRTSYLKIKNNTTFIL